MNIGIVTQWFPSGAGYVSKAYRNILENDNNVFIYARGGINMKGNIDWDDKSVTWAPYHSCLTGIHYNHFKKWVKKNKINIIIYNEQRYWQGVLFSKKLNVITGAYIDYYKQDTIDLFNLYDFVITNTNRHFSVFKNHPQCLFYKWGTFDNQKNFKVFDTTLVNRKLTFIISSGWDGKYASKSPWMDRRGTGLILKIFNEYNFDCKLIIYSQVEYENCPIFWQNIINKNSNIYFKYGTFSPFPYHEGDIYLYPSRLDGIGLTLPEAISNGLPVITTNNPPMNEFVEDNVNGFLIDIERNCSRPDAYYWPESICDEISLANAIQKYINNPDIILNHNLGAVNKAKLDLNWVINTKNICQDFMLLKKIEIDLKQFSKLVKDQDNKDNPSPYTMLKFSIRAYFSLFLNYLNLK